MSFTARYRSECAAPECPTGYIRPGDEVRYTDDGLMHVACVSSIERRPLDPYCNACGLHHRGVC